MKHVISPADYRVFAGPDWPSYDAVIAGETGTDPVIQQEVQEFVRMMQDNYAAQTLHGDGLAQANQQRQGQVFFDKQYRGSPCTVPWTTMGVNNNGDVFICSSPSWIPRFVGNILKCHSIYDVLNSELAQSIRQEILDGRYTYCNNKLCSFFGSVNPNQYRPQGPKVEPRPVQSRPELMVQQIPTNIVLDFDYTCNFRCPSCRIDVINNNRHHVIRPVNDQIAQAVKHKIIDQIQDQSVLIRWCGGEPFISDVYLDIIQYIVDQQRSNIRHIIQTNGSYLQKKSDLICALLPTLAEIRVSFDAATADTYHKIRVNGQWDQLVSNVRWLRDTINSLGCNTQLTADYVVQLANYKEIKEFVDLSRHLGIDHINLQKMWNWGTWSQTEFDYNNVYSPAHPEYQNLVAEFRRAGRPMSLI
jgi:sulfatase maturation enzyme AslB (radical SAM superfamily)